MTKVAEFTTETFANIFARRAAEETGKAVYYWFDKQEEKFKVQYEDEAA